MANQGENLPRNAIGVIFKFIVFFTIVLATLNGSAQFCDQAQATAGFPSDPSCQTAVCNQDGFCCTSSWDQLCANLAATSPACAGCLSTAGGGGTGCTNTVAFGTVAAPTNGTPLTISTCTWQTEYNTITGVQAGQTYTSASSCGGFITVRSGTFNGPVVASGNAPLTWTATANGNHFIHYNTNALCGTATNCCTTTITCISCGSVDTDCVNAIAFGTAEAPTSGTPTVISTCTFQTEYNTITGIVAGQTYTSSSSCGGYITVRSGTAGGPVVAQGNSPLTWTATINGTYYIHYNTNALCGTASNCCSTSISCVSCGVAGGSDCCEANGTPGCNDITCQSIVCAIDPFCCNTTWDAVCAQTAEANCNCGGSTGGGGGFIVIETGQLTPQQLIQDVFLGECLSASNITFTGATTAIGTFSNGGAIGIDSGIILTSGLANIATGPNDQGAAGFDHGLPGHPLLTTAAGMQTYDAAVFQFNFEAQTDQVTFTYVFGSEEYPEFVCSTFNDVFGFFVSGPGYAANTNIATVPNTTVPVAINTVHNQAGCPFAFPQYYIDNTGGQATQYDGFTTPLTATINTVPCETYTIIIAIADAGDGIYDSAVFLEAESFSAGTEFDILATVNQTDPSDETNCENFGFFIFEISEPLLESVTLVFEVIIEGSVLFTQPIPVSVTFPPFSTLEAIPIQAITGTVGDGLSSATIVLNTDFNPDLGCSCQTEEITSTLFFCDPQIFLSVEWLGFHAKPINDDSEVLCSWIVTNEVRTDYYTVERSLNMIDWVDIGAVSASGTASGHQDYQFIDRDPFLGMAYYRIREVDQDGEVGYSEVRQVTLHQNGTLDVYPNPSTGVFFLSGYEKGDLSVYDMTGREVPFRLNFTGELTLPTAAPGNYIVELVEPDQGTTQKVRIVLQ